MDWSDRPSAALGKFATRRPCRHARTRARDPVRAATTADALDRRGVRGTGPRTARALAPVIMPRPYPRAESEVIAALRALAPGARVVSDIPGLVWQADRITP